MRVSRLLSCSGSGFSVSTIQPPANFASNSRTRHRSGICRLEQAARQKLLGLVPHSEWKQRREQSRSWQCSAILTCLLCDFPDQGHRHCSLPFSFPPEWTSQVCSWLKLWWLRHFTLPPIGHKWHEAEIWITAPGKAYGVLVLSTDTRDGIFISGLCLRKPFHHQEFLYRFCTLRCLKPSLHPRRFTWLTLTLFPTSPIWRQAESLLTSTRSICSNLQTHPTAKHMKAVTWPSDSFPSKLPSFTLLCWTAEKHLFWPAYLCPISFLICSSKMFPPFIGDWQQKPVSCVQL